jgi:hypothetical protein
MSLKSARDEELTFLSRSIFIAIKIGVKQREPSPNFNTFKFYFSRFFLRLSTYPRATETKNGKKHRELNKYVPNIIHRPKDNN